MIFLHRIPNVVPLIADIKMKTLSVFLIISISILISCSDNPKSDKTLFTVMLTDLPADYEEVLIDIQDVRINPSGINDEESWISLEHVNKGIYNLLDFTNGLDMLLAEQELPPGLITQMRLVLGNNNKVKKEDVYYDLDTPSAQQAGLKLNIHAELQAGIDYKIWIDFDAGRSIIEKGNGTFSLKPVIRTYTEATNGAIRGKVDPVDAEPYIMAITTENNTFGTYADTQTGEFLIGGLAEGTYKVELVPSTQYNPVIIEDIGVSDGQITDLGTITFTLAE